MESRKLSIPIYLNQRIVFDLLAIVEGGFSQFQSIKTAEAGEKVTKGGGGAEVGAKNVFAFLNLGIKGGLERQSSSSTQKEVEEQRVFTPASLFSRLRDSLVEKKLLVTVENTITEKNLEAGTFIELSGILKKNPLIATMEGLIQLIEMASIFTKDANKPKPKLGEHEIMLGQMKKFLNSITQSGFLDLITEPVTAPQIKVVIPVQQQYFSSESPADVIDGQFVVLGKIARHVRSDSGESISLLRGTPFAYMPEENTTQALKAFSELSKTVKQSEEFSTTVPGPALQVIPIAIYA